ncbi:MAG TPA: iron-sulfur cluster assembly accessory protein [Saprospiraceae bacterium]|jgi:iron-sulfur cluster assembly protein|nr:MAG: iron-sulfur cluster assembly accessory protein [Candidatus Parvibacillus calidus]MBX2936573.1 iron-sulfur cluster assembly accessory protein [Saprospiraceae bacterium]MBK7739387.1 iron-sulfur cluster assembly accessory protein [Candidatus Parvibacillus calidus]MBX7179371.1 iron-sulfur cluster assembly accessory protein [Saprospiraceae bacterium]MCB0591001.1 iron-sulfur cluster assembly accessory protein [Saprospiraceae bacterium]
MIEENTTEQILTLTPGAIRQLAIIRQEQSIPEDLGLRVGVKGGGCSGFSYELGFDSYKMGDEVIIIDGLEVYMQKSHSIYLKGIEIDWEEGLNNRGFSFKNPNASSTCGCGTSFSA